MATIHRALILGAVVASVAAAVLLAAACGGDEAKTDSSAQQSDVQALQDRIQRNEMLYTNIDLQALPIHEMNETIVNDGRAEGTFLPTTRTLIRIVGLTNWSATLQPDATAMQDHAIALVRALEDGDMETAKTASTSMHDAWHQFTVKVWAEIGGELPPEAGTTSDDDDHESTTPAAGETPAEEDHDE